MVSITSASTFTIGRSCWSTPESAFERAKHLGGAGSGLVSLARHCLDDEAAVAIQPTFSGKTKLEASGNWFQASRCQSGRLLVCGQAPGSLRCGLLLSVGDTLGQPFLLLFLLAGGQRVVVPLDQLPVRRALLQRDVVGPHLRQLHPSLGVETPEFHAL